MHITRFIGLKFFQSFRDSIDMPVSANLAIIGVLIIVLIGAWWASIRTAKKAALGGVSANEVRQIGKINENNLKLQEEYANDRGKLGNRPPDIDGVRSTDGGGPPNVPGA